MDYTNNNKIVNLFNNGAQDEINKFLDSNNLKEVVVTEDSFLLHGSMSLDKVESESRFQKKCSEYNKNNYYFELHLHNHNQKTNYYYSPVEKQYYDKLFNKVIIEKKDSIISDSAINIVIKIDR